MNMRKILAIVAAVLMLCSILPLSAMAADTEIVFALGSNGSASHADGSSKNSYTETVSGYTLTLSNVSNFYTGARDAKGNSCIKLGASSKAGSFTLTAPDDVVSVIIAVAQYKANATKLTVNGTSYTITTASNNGAYTDITVDTTTNKTVTLTTVSGGYRAMVNTITYVVGGGSSEPDCEHEWSDATCTEPATCSLCDATDGEALGHNYVADIIEATCTATGSAVYECSVCFDSYDETIPMIPHNYVDGTCDACGAEMPQEVTITFDANKTQRTEYSTTKQVWENNGLKLTNNKASSTNNVGDYSNPARFYKSSQIVIEFPGMTSLVIDASGISSNGDWKATLGDKNYTAENGIYTITFNPPVDSVTLTCAAQVRANSITAAAVKSDCEHDYVGVETQAATCTETGVMTYTCSKCEESYTEAIAVIPHDYVEDIIDATCTTPGTKTYECSVCFDSYDEAIPVKSHNYVDDICSDCGAVKIYSATITFDTDKTQRAEHSTTKQVWKNDGLTFTNNKGASTTNVGDYSAPVRLYKNSDIIVEFPEMVTLVIDASGIENEYVTPWNQILENANLSYTVADDVYTITFAEAVNSVALKATAQVRANSITAKVLCGHSYDNEYDAECNKCGEIREVEAPIATGGKSVSPDVEGLAFLFSVEADVAIAFERITEIDYTNSSFGEYKLNNMGAKMSNGFEEITIDAKYLYGKTDSTATYAVRIVELDEEFKKDCVITATPFMVVELDGVETTIYGEMQSASYNSVLNG